MFLENCSLKEPVRSLHIHTSSDKNVTELVTKQETGETPFSFIPLHLAKKFADMMFGKKSFEHSRLSRSHRNGFLWYTGHGINLLCKDGF